MQTRKILQENSLAGVSEFIERSGDEDIRAIFANVLSSFENGYGRYNSDGSFDAHAPIFGKPITPVTPTHRRLRTSLLELIRYSQGTSYYVENLHHKGLADRHSEHDMLYKEVHIKRSQMLLNEHYKADGKAHGTTLSEFTGWGITNNYKNRVRIRNKVAPVFEYYGFWSVYRDDGGHATFTAGPALLLLAECVLDKVSDDFDGAVQ